MPLYVQLPPNLCSNLKHQGKSIYISDFCSRHKKSNGRHSRTKTAPPTFITKESLDGGILTEHYSPLPVTSVGKKYEDTIENIRKKNAKKSGKYSAKGGIQTTEHPTEVIAQIEEVWLNEADANKRQRGNIYGINGKKMSITAKPKVDDKVPGLKNWLDKSNEYEKSIVQNFLQNIVSNDNNTIRPQSTASVSSNVPSIGGEESMEEGIETSQLLGKSVRIHTPPKSGTPTKANPPLLTKRLPVSPPAKASVFVKQMQDCSGVELDSRGSSRCSSRTSTASSVSSASSHRNDAGHHVSTQLPHPHDAKPSSPQYKNNKHQRSMTAPEKGHSCQDCEACKLKLYKTMLNDLDQCQPKPYSELKAENIKRKSKSTYLYPPLEDYTHAGTSFQQVNGFKRNYFIIHPDFVSENRNMASQKWKANKKYFGESKSIL